MLKIAHITDSHISAEGQTLDGIDTRKQFNRVLNTIRESDYDIIVHSGDLCFPEGDDSVYRWIREKMDATGLPYCLSPGNHDSPALMQEIFNLKDLPPRVILNGAIGARGESLMFLDSSSERLSLRQAGWLSREIEVQDDDLILFMHHPPCPCGVRLMDENYPFKNPDFFQKTIRETGRSITLFTGHYHIEKTLCPPQSGITVHITPTTFGSLDPESEDYRMSDLRPGWREICIDNQKLLSTACRYLNQDVDQ